MSGLDVSRKTRSKRTEVRTEGEATAGGKWSNVDNEIRQFKYILPFVQDERIFHPPNPARENGTWRPGGQIETDVNSVEFSNAVLRGENTSWRRFKGAK